MAKKASLRSAVDSPDFR